jgi:hypothetical protein
MSDTRATTGTEAKIRELTLAELATVSGAFFRQVPAPLPGLYQSEVFTDGYWPGQYPTSLF